MATRVDGGPKTNKTVAPPPTPAKPPTSPLAFTYPLASLSRQTTNPTTDPHRLSLDGENSVSTPCKRPFVPCRARPVRSSEPPLGSDKTANSPLHTPRCLQSTWSRPSLYHCDAPPAPWCANREHPRPHGQCVYARLQAYTTLVSLPRTWGFHVQGHQSNTKNNGEGHKLFSCPSSFLPFPYETPNRGERGRRNTQTIITLPFPLPDLYLLSPPPACPCPTT